MYGNLPGITEGPPKALATPNNTMVGVGMTPEAIEHNPIVYDLMVSIALLLCVVLRCSDDVFVFSVLCCVGFVQCVVFYML